MTRNPINKLDIHPLVDPWPNVGSRHDERVFMRVVPDAFWSWIAGCWKLELEGECGKGKKGEEKNKRGLDKLKRRFSEPHGVDFTVGYVAVVNVWREASLSWRFYVVRI